MIWFSKDSWTLDAAQRPPYANEKARAAVKTEFATAIQRKTFCITKENYHLFNFDKYTSDI